MDTSLHFFNWLDYDAAAPAACSPSSTLGAPLCQLCSTLLTGSRLPGSLHQHHDHAIMIMIMIVWPQCTCSDHDHVHDYDHDHLATVYLLLQGVSEPGAAATLGAAAAPGRADRTKHCRDQLEVSSRSPLS